MGLLDRFKSKDGASPDMLTKEAMLRVRSLPDVAEVAARDADTLGVTWTGADGAVDVSLADLRPEWTAATGFERIEVMDRWLEGLGPPTTDLGDTGPVLDPIPADPEPAAEPQAQPAPSTAPSPAPAGDGAAMLSRLVVVVTPGATGDPARWAITPELEAHLALDRADALPVTAQELGEWGATLAEARAVAVETLVAGGLGLDALGDGLAAFVATRPDHKAGWLAAPDELLRASGFSSAVVLTPAPTELVVADSDDAHTVVSLLTSTKTILASITDVLWPAPLRVDGDGVRAYDPGPDHPAAELVAQMRTLG